MSSSKRVRSLAWVQALAAAALLSMTGSAGAAIDVAAIRVEPLHGQSADRARRDRYECHNWAVEQTGESPSSVSGQQAAERRDDDAERARRAARVINSASVGAAIGGLVRSTQRKNPANGVLAGAAIGAAVGAATNRSKNKDAKADAEPLADYVRALSACLEGRGYRVEIPGDDAESVADNAVTAVK